MAGKTVQTSRLPGERRYASVEEVLPVHASHARRHYIRKGLRASKVGFSEKRLAVHRQNRQLVGRPRQRRNDDVAVVVLQAGTHETGTVEGRHARRAVRVQTQRRQQRGLHRRPVLRVDVQRVLQAPEAHEVGTRELGAVQGGGAAVARGQPEGQTAARRRRADRSDILLPPRVRLPAETVAEEAVALTKTLPLPPPPHHRPLRRAPSPTPPKVSHTTVVASILFIIMIILLLLRNVSIVFALFLNYYYFIIVERCKTLILLCEIPVRPMYGQKKKNVFKLKFFTVSCLCGARNKPLRTGSSAPETENG